MNTNLQFDHTHYTKTWNPTASVDNKPTHRTDVQCQPKQNSKLFWFARFTIARFTLHKANKCNTTPRWIRTCNEAETTTIRNLFFNNFPHKNQSFKILKPCTTFVQNVPPSVQTTQGTVTTANDGREELCLDLSAFAMLRIVCSGAALGSTSTCV